MESRVIGSPQWLPNELRPTRIKKTVDTKAENKSKGTSNSTVQSSNPEEPPTENAGVGPIDRKSDVHYGHSKTPDYTPKKLGRTSSPFNMTTTQSQFQSRIINPNSLDPFASLQKYSNVQKDAKTRRAFIGLMVLLSLFLLLVALLIIYLYSVRLR